MALLQGLAGFQPPASTGTVIDSHREGALPLRKDVAGSAATWRFGNAELHDDQARLWVEGRAHDLDHSCNEVLRCLLAEAGKVVSKDRLLEIGWPGRVVSENSLAKAVGRLRQALEDPDGELLCTVHGYGYRLATTAERVPFEASTVAALLPPPLPRRSLVLPLAATLSALLIGLLAWWAGTGAIEAVPATSAPAAPTAPAAPASIAVLPFADMSPKGDQAYFGDGLADELLDRLAKIPQLHVAGRTSSFSFRGKDDDVAAIGRKLGVRNVLEGSVRKSGDRIRITVQLIDARTGFHLWSQTYDRALTDLFAVQDEIAQAVVAELELKLLPEQREALLRHHTASLAAYEQYLLSRQMRQQGTLDNQRRAVAALERAIVLDPKFALAHLELADLLGGEAEYADTPAAMAAGKERSLAMMDKAIALDPDNADFYSRRADFQYSTRWDWAAAQRDIDRAAALEPATNVHRMVRQSRLWAALGRLPEALEVDRQMIRINPDFSDPWTLAGYHSLAAGRYPEARVALLRALQLRPNDPHATFHLGTVSLLEGNPQAALEVHERGGGVFRLAGMAIALQAAGREPEAADLLATLVSRYAHSGAYQIAQVYASRGDREQAFAWLDRAARQHDAGLIYLKFDPLMRNLHGDPRYTAWLKRMRLSD